MIISIVRPSLSEADKSLLKACFTQLSSCAVVCHGDGVYAPQLQSAFIDELLTLNAQQDNQVLIYALGEDISLRGVREDARIKVITHNDLAALSHEHKQWVTL